LRSGRLDADVDDVVGGDVGGRLKVTCRGCPRCDGGGERTGGACATGRPPVRRLGWFCICRCPGCFEAECGYLVGSIAYLQEKEMC
jgi:hypothetical protein